MAQQREPQREQQETFEIVGSRGRRKTCRFDAEELSLNEMGLERIPPEIARCTRLRWLDISWNKIQKLENLPHTLHTLDIGCNEIRVLENLPHTLHTLHISFNRIGKLENLPHTLHFLRISFNRIRKLENLPHTLHTLDIGWNNQIRKLENLPPYLEKIYTDVRDSVVEDINSGERAAAQRDRDRREILRDFLSCCPLVQHTRICSSGTAATQP